MSKKERLTLLCLINFLLRIDELRSVDDDFVHVFVVRQNGFHEKQKQQRPHVDQTDRRSALKERLVVAEQVEHEGA